VKPKTSVNQLEIVYLDGWVTCLLVCSSWRICHQIPDGEMDEVALGFVAPSSATA
jgi:hypothetical protein